MAEFFSRDSANERFGVLGCILGCKTEFEAFLQKSQPTVLAWPL